MKFGIVGCGVIGRLHAQQLSLVEHAEIVAFADVVPDRAKQYADEFGGKAYDSLEALLSDPNVEAVTVCTPSGMHGEMAIAAAKRGKHVIVEKPMDVRLSVADKMIEACREAGVTLGCIFQHRFDESTQKVKRYLEEGRFGKIVLVNGQVHWYRSDAYYASGDWRGTWALDGGGVLMNQAIHTIDLVQYLGGPVRQVFAQTRNALHPRIEVEDAAASTFSFANGAIGTFTATTCAFPGLATRVEIIGEYGTCIIEDTKLVYEHFRSGDDVGTHGIGLAESNQAAAEAEPEPESGIQHRVYGNTHYHQFVDFIDSVRAGRDPFVPGEQGRPALEIILGIYRSAESGMPVELPLVD